MAGQRLEIERIIEQVKSKDSRLGVPLQTFIEESTSIDDILMSSKFVYKERTLKIWVRKAATIGIITALEVYFKDKLIDLAIRRRKLGNLVKENDVINLKVLLDKRTKTFTLNELMIYSILQKYRFLNLESIKEAYSLVLKADFVDLLKANAVRLSDTGKVKIVPYTKKRQSDFYLEPDFYPKIRSRH